MENQISYQHQTKMNKISVVIITYNEEKNIQRCLDSIVEIADEILIVDSYSKDKTKEICERYKVRIVEHPFEGHIQQKNYAAGLATYDYVLSLDADEALSPVLREEIIKVKNNFDADGYFFNRLNNYCGKWIKHCGWYPDQKLRLWNRRKGQWGGENPHDKYIMQPGSKIKYLEGDLLHFSYHSIHQHIDQVNKFTDIGSKVSFNKGKKAGILKIIVYPFWKFLKDYIFNLGVLDGYYGFVICTISAHATFVKYIKMRELYKK